MQLKNSFKQKWLWVKLLPIGMALTTGLHAQELPFTHYTPDSEVNPLPSAVIHDVYQDRLGYIWLAVFSSGLIRYDGHTMELFNVADGLLDLDIMEVLEDHQGRLWVGSNAGLVVSELPLGQYEPGKQVRFTNTIGSVRLVRTTVRQHRLIVDQAGRICVGTANEGIIRYSVTDTLVTADTLQTTISEQAETPGVRCLLLRRDHSIWVALQEGSFLVFPPGGSKPEILRDRNPDNQRTSVMYETADGRLWGGGLNGLLWRLREEGEPLFEEMIFLDSPISDFLSSPDGPLYVASYGSGLLKLWPDTPGKKTVYTRKNGLLSDNIYTLTSDLEGNLWIAQLAGLSKLRANHLAFEAYTANSVAGHPPVLPAAAVSTVVPVSSGPAAGIWIGTEGGVVYLREPEEFRIIRTEDGLSSNWVDGLSVDQHGRVWIGTNDGINCVSLNPSAPPPGSRTNKQLTILDLRARVGAYQEGSINASANLRLPVVTPIDERAAIESIWFPSYRYVYCLIQNRWWLFGEDSGLPPTWFYAVATDDRGHVWIGSRDQGLYRSTMPISPENLTNLSKRRLVPSREKKLSGYEITGALFEEVWSRATGAPTNQVETLAWHDENLWVGTQEGLIILSGDPVQEVHRITQAEGLNAKNVPSIAFSPSSGFLWAGTNGGLAKIDPRSYQVQKTITKQDGLVDNEVWYYGSVAVDQDETVYFGTAKGLSLYRPPLDMTNAKPPTLRIRKVTFEEDGTGNNEIAIEYAALSYASEKRVRYKTRLAGYDRSWSQEKQDWKIRYTNLSAFFTARTYTFEVIACNSDGVWTTEPVTYSFAVNPPWWFRWWACLIYVMASAVTIVSIERRQRRQLLHKEREKARIHEAELRAEIAEAENQRRARELKAAKELQLSMLPDDMPQHPGFDIAAYMRPATEVGGDYYDFHEKDGIVTIAIGDATGHGLNAGMMVTAAKSLFQSLAGDSSSLEIIEKSNQVLKQMNLKSLQMALLVLRLDGHKVTISSAGMPPTLVHRAETGHLEEIVLKAMPLGSFNDFPYEQRQLEVSPGDTIILMSDGLPERFNPKKELLDNERVHEAVKAVVERSPKEIIEHLVKVGDGWAMGRPQNDDVTFVVIKIGSSNEVSKASA